MPGPGVLAADPQKVTQDIAFLMDCFRDVLYEAGETTLAQHLPWQTTSSPNINISTERIAQAYTISFNLLNMVEQNALVQRRRTTEATHGLTAVHARWATCLQELQTRGLSPEQIAESLHRMHVEPVLTAHPTEAKRATVLEHHRRLYRLLVQRENRMWTPYEQNAIRAEIKRLK